MVRRVGFGLVSSGLRGVILLTRAVTTLFRDCEVIFCLICLVCHVM